MQLGEGELMVNRRLVIFFVLLAVLVLGVVSVMVYFSAQRIPSSTPTVQYSTDISSLNTKDLNVSQGTKLQLNLTFTSHGTEQLTIPIENLTLLNYDGSMPMDYKSWNFSSNWSPTIPQERVFNYTFGANRITLQPALSNSTILTIYVAEDAPLGKYAFGINLGTVTSESELPYSGSVGLGLIVTPKAVDFSHMNNGVNWVGTQTLQLSRNASELSVSRGSSTQGTILVDVLKDDPLRIFVDDAMFNATESSMPQGVSITVNINGQDVPIPSSHSMSGVPIAADLLTTTLGQNAIKYTVSASEDVPVGRYSVLLAIQSWLSDETKCEYGLLYNLVLNIH